MTTDEAKAKLQDIIDNNGGDLEAAHLEADDIITDLLFSLGYEDVVALWLKVPKWYA